tara:strand:- start:4707 stop:4904 length:198 start_codon:yes stop_codon:yes gene_type:complete
MTDVLEFLVKKLEDEREIIAKELIRGNAQDYAAYKERCGASNGLLRAIYIIEEAAKNLREDEDNE